MADDDNNIFGKDFEDVDEKDNPETPEDMAAIGAEQLLPVSEFEKMIEKMNLDLHVRTTALQISGKMGYTLNSDADLLIANAEKIEQYLIHGTNPLTPSS